MTRKIIAALIVLILIAGGAYVYFQREASMPVAAGTPRISTAQTGDTIPADGDYWTKRCNEQGEKYCEIFQRLMIEETNQRLIEFAIGFSKESKNTAQAAIVLPLGVMVAEGIVLKIGDEAPAKADYRLCSQEGCFVVMQLPEDFLTSMRKGEKITVSFLDGSGQQINVDLSLQGFAKKIDELKS